jgi:hypothetical protein
MHDTTRVPADPPRQPLPAPARGDLAGPTARPAPFSFRTSEVVLVGLLAAFFAAFSHFPMWNTDVWAHLRFGQEIVRTRALPKHEPFPETEGFADKKAPYIHYQWLAQAGAYLIYQAGADLSPADADHRLGGGALFLVTTHALLIVLRFVLLYLAFRRLSGSPPVALLGVALVGGMGMVVHLPIIRPQVIGELAFAAVLLPLSRPQLSRRALLLVPLVFLVWANCHGSFAMGFLLLGAVTAGRAVEVVWGEGTGWLPSPRAAFRAMWADVQFRRLTALTALSVLATAANPHGPYLLYSSYALSKNPNIPTMEEWKPLPLGSAVNTVFVGSVVVVAVLLRLSPRRFTPAQVLLLLGFGLQSVAHARMVVWWIMVFAWVAVPHIRAVAGRLPSRLPWLDDASRPSRLKTALAAALALVLVVASRPAWWLLWGNAPASEGRVVAVTPVHVLDRIHTIDRPQESALPDPVGPPPHVLFASETLGDYLLWDLGRHPQEPSWRLSCYTHVHLFPEAHWKKCMAVKNADPGWQNVLDEMGVDYLVLEDELYDQEGRRKQGKSPGFSNLIDRVREAPGRWKVVSEPDAPVFIAQRIR